MKSNRIINISEKAAKKFRELEELSSLIHSPFWWLNTEAVLIGGNDETFEALGSSREDIVGKYAHEYYPLEVANRLLENVKLVVSSNKAIKFEEQIIDVTTKKVRWYAVTRSPLYDEDGEIIGTLGTAIEITAEKEAALLRLENQSLRSQAVETQLEEYKKFKQIADQMAHDLGSPLMALSVLGNNCTELPEIKRNMLKESIHRVRDIAGSLLDQYKPVHEYIDTKSTKENLLVYPILEQIIMDKQCEYQDKPINFKCEYAKDNIFSFIEIDSALFKRMLSNLINNAVEATESGEIILKLDCNNDMVQISIIDNGCGMPQEIIDKIINNRPVTFGKVNGHGIGFSQIHETLKQCNGRISINSKLQVGTTIILTFPRMKSPNWIIEEIVVNPKNVIVILDDDNSIHGAWDIRFEEFIKTNPNIKIHHFKHANDVLNFINDSNEKENILLLSDYELLRQNIDGLQVIEQAHIKRSVLVTSHYSDTKIQERATLINTKILPKVLASEVSISLNTSTN